MILQVILYVHSTYITSHSHGVSERGCLDYFLGWSTHLTAILLSYGIYQLTGWRLRVITIFGASLAFGWLNT